MVYATKGDYFNIVFIFLLLLPQCSRSPQVLLQTMTMVERAISLDGNNADFYNECGYQQMMQGKNRDSVKSYRTAMKLDETSVVALTGRLLL